jgi:hypothetical protein
MIGTDPAAAAIVIVMETMKTEINIIVILHLKDGKIICRLGRLCDANIRSQSRYNEKRSEFTRCAHSIGSDPSRLKLVPTAVIKCKSDVTGY